ncbi:MAG: thioredoxin fold domain-containing protein [Thiomargarita sp.]|nr:thioredoxin fold domain-containing protein [Thiomargarita sp.]
MKYIALISILLTAGGGYLAFATIDDDTTKVVAVATQSSDDSIPAAVQDGINSLKTLLEVTDSTAVSVMPSDINGLYEIVIGSNIFYLGDDGKYFVAGNIYRINKESTAEKGISVANITDERRAAILNPLRKGMIDSLNEKDMVVFAPEGETKYTVNVFTDVNCGYCAKFHNQMKALNQAGIKVRYLAFPRAGIGSDTYKIMQSVWCADDRQTAMTKAKAREKIEEITCNNPIESQYNSGQEMGVTGTPALLLSNGELIPGYLPTEQLVLMLQHKDL